MAKTKKFVVLVSPDGQTRIAVKQGWSWPAFFFSFIWAFVKGLTVQGFITLGVAIVLLLLSPAFGTPFSLFSGLVFGLRGNGWLRSKWLQAGYGEAGLVEATSLAEAARR